MDGTVKHWNFMSGQLLKSMTAGDPVASMVGTNWEASSVLLSAYSFQPKMSHNLPAPHLYAGDPSR